MTNEARKDFAGEPIERIQLHFGDVVERYQQPIASFIYSFVFDVETARDLTQEVFVKAFRSLPSFDPSRPLSSWLFGIASNHARDFIRRRRIPTDSLDETGENIPDGGADPAKASFLRELGDSLSAALAMLPLDDRELVLMRHVAELSVPEIAAISNLSEANVKVRLFRARQRLQAILGRDSFL